MVMGLELSWAVAYIISCTKIPKGMGRRFASLLLQIDGKGCSPSMSKPASTTVRTIAAMAQIDRHAASNIVTSSESRILSFSPAFDYLLNARPSECLSCSIL